MGKGAFMRTSRAATKTTQGPVKMAAYQAPAVGANPTKAEFDSLLTKLKNAGLMATS